MPPNKLVSSFLVIISTYSATSSPHLYSAQLPYRNFTQSLNVRCYKQTSHQIWPSSLITPLKRSNIALLAKYIKAEAEDFQGKVEDLSKDVVKQVDETTTHETFLKEESNSNLDNSIFDEIFNYEIKDSKDFESYKKDLNNKREQSN